MAATRGPVQPRQTVRLHVPSGLDQSDAACSSPSSAPRSKRSSVRAGSHGRCGNSGLDEFFGYLNVELQQQPERAPASFGRSSLAMILRRTTSAQGSLGPSSILCGEVDMVATRTDSHVIKSVRSKTCDFIFASRPLVTAGRASERATDGDDNASKGAVCVDSHAKSLGLRVRIPADPSDWGGFVQVLRAWAEVAMKALPDISTAVPWKTLVAAPVLQAVLSQSQLASTALSVVPAGSLQLKVAGIGGQLSTHIGLLSLSSAVLFIGSIRGLNTHGTARQGNLLGVIATTLGIISVLASPGFNSAHLRFIVTFAVAATSGYGVASNVAMEDMPQLVAGFHSFVGLAAVFAGFASYLNPADSHFHFLKALEMFAGVSVGALTFTGSVVAAGKLHGVLPGRPILLEPRWTMNFAAVGVSFGLSLIFASPWAYHTHYGAFSLLTNAGLWGFLGVNMVLPVGGADMPVVVSLLNAFSGLATSAAGFMLSNNLLTITGALVASSGTLLSDIMCRGINRSMYNVLLGGFGTDDSAGRASSVALAAGGDVHEVSAMGFVGTLLGARKVVIIPGYGVAVARCQSRLADIVALLRRHGVVVHFAIHPVAGRLPGHMNVLLAEADVPYDIVKEMDDINAHLGDYDAGIVIGANDIVNPSTQTDPNSPIYGMPVIEVWKCRTCVVLKRSLGTGYSGVDNPLFFRDNVRMLFGDAKQTVDSIFHLLEENQDQLLGGADWVDSGAETPTSPGTAAAAAEQRRLAEEASFPPPSKVVGVLRERRSGEQRVAITPASIPRLRKMGFTVLLEAGAGSQAGFSDEDYVQRGGTGGVQVAESPAEVLRQADVVFKANDPLLDEIQVLQGTQTMIGFWNMYETPHLLEALGQSTATVLNLALVPRVSRAQKMDALTSMANIAGYRAVLEAFVHLPRFSRSSVTASGAVPPAKVLVIGAGVAGLSAIATAHSLGANVYANDVRDAAREQVESLGAEFIPVDAAGTAGIVGEGVGGYASEMSSDFLERQLATYARLVRDVDVVIATAMIPNRKAPVLITEDMVATMQKGSVIADLAASAGGNCALTNRDQVVLSKNGVTILGETNYAAAMAAQASDLLANNFLALLDTLGGATDFGGDHWKDPIIQPAMVANQGQLLWPPTPMPQPQEEGVGHPTLGAVSSGTTAPQPSTSPVLTPEVPEVPPQVQALLKFIEDNKHELCCSVGTCVAVGLGLTLDVPQEEVMHIGYFALSLLIGHFTVAGVTPALHTPLISVTNAISGIIVVGGMLQLQGPLLSARVGCALAAVFLASVNIVGGFAVTQRMLEMFKQESRIAVGLA